MKKNGPSIESMIDHLAAIPSEFMRGRSALESGKRPSLPALINDLLLDCGGSPAGDDEMAKIHQPVSDKQAGELDKRVNYHQLLAIVCYILSDDFFISKKTEAELVKKFLFSFELKNLSDAVDSADEFVNDADRREEICRMSLRALNFLPFGETEKNAEDRLRTLDSVERKKILTKTLEAQMRAKQIREAMMRRDAEEAASKMSRE